MEKKQIITNKFWHILNLGEDYFSGGYKQVHHAPPQVQVRKLSPEERKQQSLELLSGNVRECVKCDLHKKRSHAVPGEGSVSPSLMVIGGVPEGADDYSGLPFQGDSGAYLDKWLNAINLDRNIHCFLTTLLKCRPYDGAMPGDLSIRACFPYLEKQIKILEPRALLALGVLPGRIISGEREAGIDALREGTFSYCGIPLICTYHPYDVLRCPELRRVVWEDLKRLKTILDI